MNKHFIVCPHNRGYDVCTCGMLGEECCIIDWEIQRIEGKLPWWALAARLTLWCFPPPKINRGRKL